MSKNLIVYNASAGSGKTYTLAMAYIGHCLSSPDTRYFSRILAITFTNKAAHELKQRIIAFLAELAGDQPDQGKIKLLAQNTGLDYETICARALAVHEIMLYEYSAIHVTTIDSFVLSILRAFSKELNLPFDFEVELDEDRINDILSESILAQVGRDQFITEQLARLVTQNLDEGRSWNPKSDISKALKLLMNEESIDHRSALSELGEPTVKAQLKALEDQRNALWNTITQAQSEARALIHASGIALEYFNRGPGGVISFASKNFKAKTWPTPTQQKLMRGDGNLFSTVGKKAGMADAVTAMREELLPSFEVVIENLEGLVLLENLYRNRMSSILALRLQGLLSALEDEQGLSIIKDNNAKIGRIIKDNPTPFIYERIGERFQHFLIDEFQDTSILQWHNMIPLIDASIAYNKQNYLVGDVKQSIYRWRGSEVDQMVDLPNIAGMEDNIILRQVAGNFDRALDRRKLEVNYRSMSAVINFNNMLFEHLSSSLAEKYQESYANVKQEINRQKSTGYVQMKAIEDKCKLEDALAPMMETIRECEADGYSGSDICILVRSNSDGREIARYLESNGQTVSSLDSLLLSGHADVHLLCSALEILGSKQALGSELYMTHRLLELHDKLDRYDECAARIKKSGSSLERINEIITSLGINWSPDTLSQLDAYACIHDLCSVLSLSTNDAYIQELMSIALAYTQGQDSSLIGFYEYWKTQQGRISVKAGSNPKSIQLMTIHKSKGLEFPVVIMPLVKWTAKKKTKTKEWVMVENAPVDRGLININKNLEGTPYEELYSKEVAKSNLDNLNLLYVACTRAEARMYIQVSNPGEGGIAQQLLAYMKHKGHPEKLIEGEPISKATAQLQENEQEQNDEIEHTAQIPSFQSHERGEMLSLALSKQMAAQHERELGDRVHSLLERHDHIDAAGVALEGLMSKDDYSEEEIHFVQESLRVAYEVESAQNWNQQGYTAYKEIDLIDAEGKGYRIDKLYLNSEDKRAVILDYKTGQKDPKNTAQMQGYADLIKTMGYQNVEAYLLYTSSGELEEVC